MLFGNKREANLRSAVKMVETVIRELGLDPAEVRLESPSPGIRHTWGLAKGSAEVHIAIRETEKQNYLRVWALLVTLPPDPTARARLFQRLLEENATTLSGAAFGLSRDIVLLVAERTTVDLDLSEVRDMVRRVGAYADYYDDLLVTEYGGQRYCDLSRM